MKRKISGLIAFFVFIIYTFIYSTTYAFALPFKNLNQVNIKNKKVIYQVNIVNRKLAVAPIKVNKNTLKVQPQKKIKEVKVFDQLKAPVKGDQVAFIKTNMGVIRIKLLPQYAPKAVENFINRVNDGYYKGLAFNRVINNSIIQGGLNTQESNNLQYSDGMDEFNSDVRNFRGAISAVSSDQGIDNGEFTIVDANFKSIGKDPLNYMESSGEKLFPKYIIDKYKKIGGAPWLDYHNVVFGQVYQGMNIVDKISQVEVDENNNPKKIIKIIKIDLLYYK